MFIFYVSLTLYKLFSNCQAENNGVFSIIAIFVKCLCVPRTVAGKQSVFVFSPNCVTFVTRGRALFTESSLFLSWVSLWLQAKELVRPVAVGVA
jgi:hypothetical protein